MIDEFIEIGIVPYMRLYFVLKKKRRNDIYKQKQLIHLHDNWKDGDGEDHTEAMKWKLLWWNSTREEIIWKIDRKSKEKEWRLNKKKLEEVRWNGTRNTALFYFTETNHNAN